MKYYSAIKKKKNEIMPYGTTWIELEIIVLREVKVKVTQSCPTLCNPTEFSRPEYWSG